MSTVAGSTLDEARTPAPGRRCPLREHWPFLLVLALGAVLRVLVQVAFMPAFIHSDGPTYLSIIADLQPYPDRPVGYVLAVLYPLSRLSRDVVLVAVAQHVMGLVTATVLYLLLRRRSVGRWVAALATVPVLLDYLQLNLEHTVLSDTLFELLMVCGLAALCWRRRVPVAYALAAGVIFGVAVTVRVVGEPLAVVGVAFCLLAGGPRWRQRLVAGAALAVGFAVPVGAYATWYHVEKGPYALTEFTGKALYLRSTSFVDCAQISVPDYQRVLCPAEPLGKRRDPTFYVFHDTRTLPRLHPPAGTTQDQALREFAMAALRAQPGEYAGIVARDFFLNFDVWSRIDRYGYETAYKWGFRHYITVRPTAWTGPAYAAHGGEQLQVRQPYADALATYQGFGYVPGPLLLACLLLGLAGGVGVRRAEDPAARSAALLMTVTGVGMLLMPDLTAQFTWRYQLPALVLLPAGAALGYAALRGAGPSAGTVATASTD